jgi:hypothetical protein
LSDVFTQYWGTIYSLKPGGKVACGVWGMLIGEVLWAAAFPEWDQEELATEKFAGMVVNLTNRVNQVGTHGERSVRFEVVNTGQISQNFDVYFAWTSGPIL